MVSVFWALGLRTAEMTGLKVRDFEPAHGKRTGLLRIRGKNKKQRALFVVDHLFDELQPIGSTGQAGPRNRQHRSEVVMTISADDFFKHVDIFFDYRQNIYEASSETLKNNRIDLAFFESYVLSLKAPRGQVLNLAG